MSKNWFFYCKPDQVDYDFSNRTEVNHMASEQFGKITVGDIIWSITCIKTRLFIFNRMTVDRVRNHDETIDYFGDDTNVYRASFHIFQYNTTPFQAIEVTNIAHALRFDGPVERLPDKFNGRNFQSLRKLTPATTEMIDDLWRNANKTHYGNIWKALETNQNILAYNYEHEKEDNSLHAVLTTRITDVQIALAPYVNSCEALSQIIPSLNRIPIIDVLTITGESLIESPLSALLELRTTRQLELRDSGISDKTIEHLRISLPHTNIKNISTTGEDNYYVTLANSPHATPDAMLYLAQRQRQIGNLTFEPFLAEATAFQEKGEYDSAWQSVSNGRQEFPEYADVFSFLAAELYFEEEQYTECIKELEQALELFPEHETCILLQISSHIRLEQFAEASSTYDEYFFYDDECYESNFEKADYFESMECDQLSKHFRAIGNTLEDNYQSYDELLESGRQHLDEGRYEKAIDCFEAMLQQRRSPEALEWLALAYCRNDDFDDAEGAINEAIIRDEDNPSLKFSLGCILFWHQKYREAVTPLRNALKAEPDNVLFQSYYGNVLYHIDSHHEAIQVCGRVLELDQNNLMALDARAHSFFDLEQFEKAKTDFSKAHQLSESADDRHYYASSLANCYYLLDQHQQARIICEEILAENPEYMLALEYLSDALIELKEFRRAVEVCNDAINLNPDEVKGYLNRHTAYLNLGNDELAAIDLKKAQELETRIS